MRRIQANILLLIAAMIWGSAFVVQQVGTGTLGTISFTGARFLVGALVVLPLAIWQGRRVHNEERHFIRSDFSWMAAAGTILFLAAAIQQYGIFHTSVVNAGFLTALYVPLVPLIGLLLLRRRVHWIVWPVSVSCVLGTYIMSGAQGLKLQFGDIWILCSTLFWASHVILIGVTASRVRAPLMVATVQFFVAGFWGLTLGQLVEQPHLIDFQKALWGITYVGIFSVGMAFTLQVVGQRYTPAADAAIILSSETVFAAIAGVLFLGERMTFSQIIGALLILGGILAVEVIPLLTRARQLE